MLKQLVRQLILWFFFVVGGYPLVWMFFCAVRSDGDLLADPLGIPKKLYFDNFQKVMESGTFGSAFCNSLLLCGVALFCTLLLSSLAAFAFAKMEFKGKKVFFILLLLGLVIPVHVTLIPLNHMLGSSGFNIKSSLFVLLGPYVGFALPITILILRGAFANIAKEQIAAAELDGCSSLQLFYSIALPQIKPALATVFIFNFLTMWNEFIFALALISSPKKRTLSLALWEFKGEYGFHIGQTCAALCLVVLPLLVVYIFAQKQIIDGLTFRDRS